MVYLVYSIEKSWFTHWLLLADPFSLGWFIVHIGLLLTEWKRISRPSITLHKIAIPGSYLKKSAVPVGNQVGNTLVLIHPPMKRAEIPWPLGNPMAMDGGMTLLHIPCFDHGSYDSEHNN